MLFAVLASGPSMSQAVADSVRGKCKVIAVSDVYKLAPWADALVSNDANWWAHNQPALKFAGRKFSGMGCAGTEKLGNNGVFGGGSNSGLQGMRVAQLMGATKILLLGFDMHGTHFFGKHPEPLRNTTPQRRKIHFQQFNKWHKSKGCEGVEVVNCTPGSALKTFPMSTLEEQLPQAEQIIEPVSNDRMSDKHQRLYIDYYASRSILSQPSRWLPRVEAMAKQVGAQTILDYGCGAVRGISSFSSYKVADYDPGVSGCTDEPLPADLVVSIHALEHVEPEYVDAVIDHMKSLAVKALFIVVSCETSTKLLPDGSAWHSFVRSVEWWKEKLSGFDAQPVMMDRPDAEYAAVLITSQAVA